MSWSCGLMIAHNFAELVQNLETCMPKLEKECIVTSFNFFYRFYVTFLIIFDQILAGVFLSEVLTAQEKKLLDGLVATSTCTVWV